MRWWQPEWAQNKVADPLPLTAKVNHTDLHKCAHLHWLEFKSAGINAWHQTCNVKDWDDSGTRWVETSGRNRIRPECQGRSDPLAIPARNRLIFFLAPESRWINLDVGLCVWRIWFCYLVRCFTFGRHKDVTSRTSQSPVQVESWEESNDHHPEKPKLLGFSGGWQRCISSAGHVIYGAREMVAHKTHLSDPVTTKKLTGQDKALGWFIDLSPDLNLRPNLTKLCSVQGKWCCQPEDNVL